jgi:hypothetical protein
MNECMYENQSRARQSVRQPPGFRASKKSHSPQAVLMIDVLRLKIRRSIWRDPSKSPDSPDIVNVAVGSVGTPCSSDAGQWDGHKPHYDAQLSDNFDQTRRSAQTVLLSRFGQSRSLAVGRGHCAGEQ